VRTHVLQWQPVVIANHACRQRSFVDQAHHVGAGKGYFTGKLVSRIEIQLSFRPNMEATEVRARDGRPASIVKKW
jgi:hypothetical protein